MSEPSPEAKHAAGWRLVKGVPDSDGDSWDVYEGDERICFDAFRDEVEPLIERHNTATAKLAEERDWYKRDAERAATCATEAHAATAKLREDLERYKKLCAIQNDFGCAGKRGNFVAAHQQPSDTDEGYNERARNTPREARSPFSPSAPTAEDVSAMQKAGYRFEPTGDGGACYPTKHGSWDKPKVRLVLDWQSYLQSSAPTANVEKIAREATSKLLRWYAGPLPPWDEKELRSIVTDALAQTRAPLVEALQYAQRDYRRRWARNTDELESLPTPYDAALTGTGECPR